MAVRILNAQEAVDLIPDGAALLTEGFVGSCFPEELAVALERRFVQTGKPVGLTLLYAAGQGDGGTRGLNHFGHEGLVKRIIGGHWNLVPKLQNLASENQVEAYNLPQGVLTHMIRDSAAGKVGTFSRVGLGTFVDPRLQGGKLNARTTEELVKLMEIEGEELLFYKRQKIDVVFIRGTQADADGNISMVRESMTCSVLAAAQAAYNNGGLVIVQVEELVPAGAINPRQVDVPGIYVNVVVKTSDPKYHMQTFATPYNPVYSCEKKMVLAELPPLPLDERKVICRRAAQEIKKGDIVNLGIGMPEGIAKIAGEEGRSSDFVLTVEVGLIGGVPQGGLDFGCSVNAQAVIDQPSQFDFYHGGGLSIAFLGMAQCDRQGNINVSKFGKRIAGAGGFIDIAQNARRVVFCGTFTAQGLGLSVGGGKLMVLQEGNVRKFVQSVEQVTFSGAYAAKQSADVLYVTERAVFKLTGEGVELMEYAPGIDIERDLLAHMDFMPIIKAPVIMDAALFT